jgi:hypothetical protein
VMSSATPNSSGRSKEPSYPTSPGYTTRDSYDIPASLRSAYQAPERSKVW